MVLHEGLVTGVNVFTKNTRDYILCGRSRIFCPRVNIPLLQGTHMSVVQAQKVTDTNYISFSFVCTILTI